MSAATPWYLDPITQRFNGGREKGVDLGVPYHTPVTPLFPGRVTGISTGPYGQEVNVAGTLNGQPVTAAYVHLDQATVAQGQIVSQNTQLGLSGGQLAGGYHPASPLYSTGPHIEFSLWPQGVTPYVGAPYDPMSYINAVQKSGGSVVTSAFASTVTPPDTAQSGLSSAPLSSVLASLAGWLPNLLGNLSNNVSTDVANGVNAGVANGVSTGITNGVQGAAAGIGHTLLTAVHVTSLPDLLKRTALIIGGIILLIIVAQAISGGAVRGTTTAVLNSEPVKAAGNVAGSVKSLVK